MIKLAITIVLLLSTSGALACPLCKDSVPNKEGAAATKNSMTSTGENISGGINTSIYVMLGALVCVMGFVGSVIVKGIRSSAGSQGRRFEVKPRSED
jgi:hypothetical protein